MKFEEALALMKAGKATERSSDYNHSRVFLVKGSLALSPEEIADESGLSFPRTSEITTGLFEAGDKDTGTRLPRFDAVDYADNTVTGWTPTATDLLATDWEVAADDGLDA